MQKEIKVPEVGESITEGTLTEWLVEEGDAVKEEQPLFELETDKVTMEVPCEFSGRIHIAVEAGAVVQVGQVVGHVDTDADAKATKEEAKAETESAPETPAASTSGEAILSPAAKVLAEQHNLSPADIPGTGKDGRITKEDVQNRLRAQDSKAAPETPATSKAAPVAASEPKPAAKAAPRKPGERQTREPMTRIRKRIAERLIEAQQTAAILTTFNEVDMTNVMALRKRNQDAFVKKYGGKLGFMSFFVKAAVDALKTFPQINAFIEGDEVVQNHYYDIGIAVGTDRGLVVPVVRDCDQLNYAEIEERIGELATAVRKKTIGLDDLTGGVFTVSNGGVYGSLMSTPILNPPQSAILGMHATKIRPMVVDGQIVARPMMYLALSYDHRIVDGKDAVGFLKRIVECIENPERMLLEV